MITIPQCAEADIRRIAESLRKVAIGQRVSFVFDEGFERIEDQGQVFEGPNGTATFRLFINGGAKDTGVPKKATIDDQHSVPGRAGDGQGTQGATEAPIAQGAE